MSTPPQLDGPPVRLDKHPSIRRKNGTVSREISRSNSATSFGSLGDRDGMSYPPMARSGESAEPPLEGDRSGENSRSNSPQDDDGDVIGPMDPDNPVPYYDVVPSRQSDGGIPNMQHRVVLPGGDSGHYEQMIHPRNSGVQGFDSYVVMKSAENGTRAISAPIPVARRNPPPLSDDTYHHLQRRQSPQNSSSPSPRNRNNYDQLPTISEGQHLHPDVNRSVPSNYENHPLPRDLKGVSVEYRPSYQNVEMARSGRRGSLNQDQYENVDSNGEQSTSQNSNTNNGNSGQKKRFSLRRRSRDKENVTLPLGGNGTSIDGKEVPSPMKNGSSDLEGYVVIQSESEGGSVNPGGVPSVGYSSIDYNSTEVVSAMRGQRQRQGQYHRSQVVASEN